MPDRDNRFELLLPRAETPVVVYQNGRPASGVQRLDGVAVLPGSFNPLHAGHRRLKAVAEEKLGRQVVFELSIANAEKRSLNVADVRHRLRQFHNDSIAVTQAPLFQHKASLFPGCCFVVGFDTARRVLDPRFYGNDAQKMRDCLQWFRESGHSFLVAGRLDQGGGFCGVEKLALPHEFQTMFVGIAETDFREDVSSTRLRKEYGDAADR